MERLTKRLPNLDVELEEPYKNDNKGIQMALQKLCDYEDIEEKHSSWDFIDLESVAIGTSIGTINKCMEAITFFLNTHREYSLTITCTEDDRFNHSNVGYDNAVYKVEKM